MGIFQRVRLPVLTDHEQRQVAALDEALGWIDQRLGELDYLLRGAHDGTYRTQELKHEVRELEAHRRVAEGQRHAIANPPPPSPEEIAARDQRERTVATLIRQRREQRMTNIVRLEGEGNFREARIARMDLLGLRGEILREFG